MEPCALGSPIPDFYDPCKNQREEQLYRDALHCEYRRFGSGTPRDPCIVWFRPYDGDRGCRWVRQHHAVVAAVAKHLGMGYVWICAAVHDEEFLRTDAGARIPDAWHADGSLKKFATRKTDPHITFRLGDGPYRCRFAAHAYVVLDAEGMPAGFLRGRDRLARRAGAPPVDVWPWTGSAAFERTVRCSLPDFDYPSYYRPYSRVSPYSTDSFCGEYMPELCGVCNRARLDGTVLPRPTGGVPPWRKPGPQREPTLETRLRIQLYEHAYVAYRARYHQIAADASPAEADLAALRRTSRRLEMLGLDISGQRNFGGRSYC